MLPAGLWGSGREHQPPNEPCSHFRLDKKEALTIPEGTGSSWSITSPTVYSHPACPAAPTFSVNRWAHHPCTFWHTQWQNHSERKPALCWRHVPVETVFLEPWKRCPFKKTKEQDGSACPPHTDPPSSCLPLYILFSTISLALPEPFWKWKAGKKKEEEKKKEKGGKKTRCGPTQS